MTEAVAMQTPPRRAGMGVRRLMSGMVPLIVYAAVVVPLAWQQRERMNPDAICYIQRAKYLAAGDFYSSISDNWSPLISWCITPLLAMGMDGLYAARAVLCFWGGALLLSLLLFLRRFTRLSEIWQMLVLVAMALVIAPICVRVITPDVILAACLFGYLSLIVHPRIGQSRGLALSAGVVGGIAYLAKAYALPFVLVHGPMSLLLQAYARRPESAAADRRMGVRRTVIACLLVVGGCLMVAVPWAGALTWRYGHFTFTGVGARAHALMLSRDVHEKTARYFGAPPGPYLIRSETQELIPYPYWSPFESNAHFRRQVEVIRDHAVRIGWAIWELDAFHCTAIAILAAAVLALPGRLGRGRWEIAWLVGTGAVYCGGFLPVYFTERYVLPILVPLGMVFCFKMIWEAGAREDSSELSRRSEAGVKVARWVLSGVVLVSFAMIGINDVNALHRQRSTGLYRAVAKEMRQRGLAGPIASPSRGDSSFVAYHAGAKFIGFPEGKDLDEVERQLKQYKPVLLIWKYQKGDRQSAAAMEVAERLVERGAWQRMFERGTLKSGMAEVYVRAGAEAE
ncbi:MAG: hypothetical protein ACM359_12800 [Bacillota bacterium]